MSAARRPPQRAWGWHALTEQWAQRIVADAHVRAGELVVDVGADHGALTQHLIDAGAHVIAVELHPERVQRLRHRFAHAPVTIVAADAATLRLPRRPFRVVANPPYGIVSRLLGVLLAPGSGLVAADLVLQKAVVPRCVQGQVPGANRWMRHWSVSAGRCVPRHAFRPPPMSTRRSCSFAHADSVSGDEVASNGEGGMVWTRTGNGRPRPGAR